MVAPRQVETTSPRVAYLHYSILEAMGLTTTSLGLVMIGNIEVPFDIVIEIVQWLRILSSQPARDVLAFLTTSKALYLLGEDTVNKGLWRRIHDEEFGSLPRDLALLPMQHNFKWRKVVEERLAYVDTDTCRLATFLGRSYQMSCDIQ